MASSRAFIAAALFLGLDFLQLGKLGGTACLGRAERLYWRFDNRLGSGASASAQAFYNSVAGASAASSAGASVSGFFTFHRPVAFSCAVSRSSAPASGAGRAPRAASAAAGSAFWVAARPRRGERAPAPRPARYVCRRRRVPPTSWPAQTAECQPAPDGRASGLPLSSLVATFPGNRRKPPDCQCAQGDAPVSPSLTRRRPRKASSLSSSRRRFSPFSPRPPHRGKVDCRQTHGQLGASAPDLSSQRGQHAPHSRSEASGAPTARQSSRLRRQLAGTTTRSCARARPAVDNTLPRHLRDLKISSSTSRKPAPMRRVRKFPEQRGGLSAYSQ